MVVRLLFLLCTIVIVVIVVSNDAPKTLRQRRLEKRVSNTRIVTSLEQDIKQHHLLQLSCNEDTALCYPTSSSSTTGLIKDHIKFYSFNDLFGNDLDFSGLFDSNSQFRKDLRVAARNDFFVKDATISNEANSLLKDPRSSLSSKWHDNMEYPTLTDVFQKYRFPSHFTGKVFMAELTKLCIETPYRFNSWMDIVGVKNKAVGHSFHQDSGLEQTTVMVGFPPEDIYGKIPYFFIIFILNIICTRGLRGLFTCCQALSSPALSAERFTKQA